MIRFSPGLGNAALGRNRLFLRGILRMTRYVKIGLGTSAAYCIENDGRCILVDAGNCHKEKRFFTALKKKGIDPGQIELIVITHVHYDHVGSLQAIQNICRCPVAVHKREAHLLQEGTVVLPPGITFLGRVVMALGKRALRRFPSFFSFQPVDPDIILSDGMTLEEFGIPGSIVHTPGHTEGSVTVILSSGEAFVGDLAINYLPFGLGPYFPPFAEDVNVLLKSWADLLDMGAKRIFPAHGESFPAEKLRSRGCRFKSRPIGF
ncbi:MAG TPA: MBL fold metallo-hydrolase [Deltaproteobacteria bacterium]|nr:MBL fold metallo-hydrolase [Deltaproteobacteria bacterium]HEU20562.1 MBL fold metallo-hydrolase [Deltaproteobacteria bacterium]